MTCDITDIRQPDLETRVAPAPYSSDSVSMVAGRVFVAMLLLSGCASSQRPLWLAEPGLAYCYRTIADPDCYRQPIAGAEERLIAIGPQVDYVPLAAIEPSSPPGD
jgi:hypothetical protein